MLTLHLPVQENSTDTIAQRVTINPVGEGLGMHTMLVRTKLGIR